MYKRSFLIGLMVQPVLKVCPRVVEPVGSVAQDVGQRCQWRRAVASRGDLARGGTAVLGL